MYYALIKPFHGYPKGTVFGFSSGEWQNIDCIDGETRKVNKTDKTFFERLEGNSILEVVTNLTKK